MWTRRRAADKPPGGRTIDDLVASRTGCASQAFVEELEKQKSALEAMLQRREQENKAKPPAAGLDEQDKPDQAAERRAAAEERAAERMRAANEKASSQPAAHFRHALQHPSRQTPAADGQIDLARLAYWDGVTRPANRVFNGVFDAKNSLYDTLMQIGRVGRAVQQTRTVKGGQVAAASTIGAGAIGAIQETVGQAHDALAGVVPHLDAAK